MSSRSQALARERASGEQYANAGERMHLEALADRAKREHKVGVFPNVQLIWPGKFSSQAGRVMSQPAEAA